VRHLCAKLAFLVANSHVCCYESHTIQEFIALTEPGGLAMLDEDVISKVFEDATAKRLEMQKQKRGTDYLDGVTAALGWALEEYSDSPID